MSSNEGRSDRGTVYPGHQWRVTVLLQYRFAKIVLWSLVVSMTTSTAFGLDRVGFRQLVVVRDEHVTAMLADRAAWLGGSEGLVVGGWNEWPNEPSVIVHRGQREDIRLPAPACAQFAVSPSGSEIAYWREVGRRRAQLAITDLSGGGPRGIGEPRPINPAMQMRWADEGTLCVLMQEDGVCKAYAVETRTGEWQMSRDLTGGMWVALRKWPEWEPIAVWEDDYGEIRCFLLRANGVAREVSGDLAYERAKPDADLYSCFGPEGALWVGGLGSREPRHVSANVAAGCWSPDGSMLLYAVATGLHCVWASAMEERELPGSVLDRPEYDGATVGGMTWSPDGTHVAYWIESKRDAQVRSAQLGVERVFAYLRFDGDFEPEMGHPVWVAKRIKYDDHGAVKEPDWTTLKGQFLIERKLEEDDGINVRAVSVGRQAGVLARIADLESCQGELRPASYVRRHVMLDPQPGLRAWVEGTEFLGRILGVEVRREPLGISTARGAMAPE